MRRLTSERYSFEVNTRNTVLVTGSAGFIGYHLALRLLQEGHLVVGLDNVNDYYEVRLKWDRLHQLEKFPGFQFYQLDIHDRAATERVFAASHIDAVIHLAAQAGVRYSLTNPHAYADSNLTGFLNVLEGCRHHQVEHFVFASSSSVYGANTDAPFSSHQNVDHPLSLYAATKKANELIAHTYAHLYDIPCTGLRFFTVYGPWGRPDMALSLFTRAILAGEPIRVFNYGKMQRDFTYVGDVVESIMRIMVKPPRGNSDWNGRTPDPASSFAPYRIYNVGNNQPVELMKFIEVIEDCLGIKAEKSLEPIQPGDVPSTYANIDDLIKDFDFHPRTPLEEGVGRFVEWYREYYQVPA